VLPPDAGDSGNAGPVASGSELNLHLRAVLERPKEQPFQGDAAAPAAWSEPGRTGLFLDPPSTPREGDNQALAVNTEDGPAHERFLPRFRGCEDAQAGILGS
jgi:hypothetical protein